MNEQIYLQQTLDTVCVRFIFFPVLFDYLIDWLVTVAEQANYLTDQKRKVVNSVGFVVFTEA